MQQSFLKNGFAISAFYLFTSLSLIACDNAKPTVEKSPNNDSNSNSNAITAAAEHSPAISASKSTSNPNPDPSIAQTTPTKVNQDGKIHIDWAKIDSGISPLDKEKFAYKFALDSKPVQNYANYYHVDAKTAQYNLTIGMAANEPLSKILDQIDTSYVSHELTAGKGSKLVIHTTPKVLPSEHNYVIEDPFGKGLILPIQIIPDGKKSANDKNLSK